MILTPAEPLAGKPETRAATAVGKIQELLKCEIAHADLHLICQIQEQIRDGARVVWRCRHCAFESFIRGRRTPSAAGSQG